MLIVTKGKNFIKATRQISNFYYNCCCLRKTSTESVSPKDYKFSNILVFNKVSR